MRGMAFEVAVLESPNNNNSNKVIKEGSFGSNNEPISVLDTRRSPSPSTSTSTRSSSFNGGATTATPLLPITDTQQNWPDSVPQEMGFSGCLTDGGRKDDWSELQPIPAERFGVGLEDWENLLSESNVSQVQDQSLRWISGDFEDTSLSLQQLLQSNQIDQNAPAAAAVSESPDFNPNFLPMFNSDHNPQLPPPAQLVQLPEVHLQHQGVQKGSIFRHNLQKDSVSDLGFQKVSIFRQNMQKEAVSDMGFQKVSIFRQNLQKEAVSDLGFQKVSIFRHNLQKEAVSDLGFQKVSNFRQNLQKEAVSDLGFEKVSNLNPGSEKVAILKQEQEPLQTVQLICDQLFVVAELMLSGNFSHAHGILARLNHQFFSDSAYSSNKPFHRAALYFKEALQMNLQTLISNENLNLNLNRITSPFNGMFKMGAYKMFSEVSPIIQFMNFTSNQALIEALGDAKNIHIIDFDIGFGAQWASLIQELPVKTGSLKLTAFASPSTHHPTELGLMHENLSQFAHETGIAFSLEVVNFDSFDPRTFSVSGNEVIAVNFPIWSASSHLSAIPSILHFIKQLSPKIVVSLDRGCERTDLPFPQYLLQGLRHYEILFDSIDGSNVDSEISNKIERFVFQPQIERFVTGKLRVPEAMPHWKSLFVAGGYSAVPFSDFTEMQAECVAKRMRVSGFHVEKRQAALVLCWRDRELVSASAWKC